MAIVFPSARLFSILVLPGILTFSWTAAPADVSPASLGQWEPPFEGEVAAVNLVLLPDGRVLYWSGVEADESDTDPTHAAFLTSSPKVAESRVLDLSTSPPEILTPAHPHGAAGDLFCAGNTVLPDGRVFTAGATHWLTLPDTATPLRGGRDAQVFDPATNDWTRVADMQVGRWYPTVLKLPDGRPLAASGVTNLTDPTTHQPSWEAYDEAADSWSTLDGTDQLLPLYPRLTVVPGGPLKGHVFYNTVGALWGPFGEHPLEALWSLQHSYDPAAGEWTTHGPSVFGARQHGVTVLLPLQPPNYIPEFLTFGGTLQRTVVATPLAERTELLDATPLNVPAATLHQGRWHANGVVLPDGSVLAVGGGLYDNVVVHGQQNVPVLEAELYDPARDAWTELPAMTVPRMYHSTAILLPDGRVLVGGHVPLPNPFKPLRDPLPGTSIAPNPQTVETRFEVYDPPYLFRGARPQILAAPTEISYGDPFDIQVNTDIGLVQSAVLVHPGATTHGFDMAQRSIHLAYEEIPGAIIRATAPPDSTVAPPGYYMLFVNRFDPDGQVPSVAKFVHLA